MRSAVMAALYMAIMIYAFPSDSFAQQANCADYDLCYEDCCDNISGGCSGIPNSPGASNGLYCANQCGFIPNTPCTQDLFCKYNTFASEFNFLEVSNRSNQTIYGSITYRTEAGAEVDVGFLKLNPYQRRDFDVHSLVGRYHYGQIFIRLGSTTALPQVSATVSHYYGAGGGVLRQTAVDPCDGAMLP